ncbi:MAG TPA: dienelactone hydrolase family protein [Opitutaceae bacterium]|jgi:phospholipase/carboxylesterase|nr:dienelactone hydrolase family protein [Opitutaceae bacterium]
MPHLHDIKDTARFGQPLSRAQGAVILVHGRGSSPHDIAGLADVFPGAGLAFLAPAATGGTWYPQRFLSPLERNEPWLSSALNVIDQLVAEVLAAGIAPGGIGLAGFSQGACLVLEYAARHPRRHGFVAGLSGALIGPPDTPRPAGNLRDTPVLLGCAELDAHIPIDYVERSAEIFSQLGAVVTKQVFPGAAHTVFPEEITWLKQHALAGG